MLFSCGIYLFACYDNNDTNSSSGPITCNHDYVILKREATCTTGGYATYKCSICDDLCQEYESAFGHTTENGTCLACLKYIGKKWTKTEVQKTIKVYDVWVSDINSVGGVSMEIGWENTSSKTIKYIYFYVQPYNAVGDVVYCEIRDHAKFEARSTGPYNPGYKCYTVYEYSGIVSGMYWENCWYNNTIRYIELYQLRIEYMDGSEVTIGEGFIDYVFAS